MQRETAKLAASIDRSMAGQVTDTLAKAFKDVDTSKISRSGSDAGDKWTSSFDKQVQTEVRKTLERIPEIEPKANMNRFDRAIVQSRKELEKLADMQVGPGRDNGLDEMSTRLDAVIKRMAKLADEARFADQRLRLLNVATQAENLKGVVDDPRAAGLADGSAYGGAYALGARKTIEAALRDLPEVKLDADPTPAERAIAVLRGELEALRDRKIGLDIDRDQFDQTLRYISGQLEQLSKEKSIPLDYDVEKAVAKLRSFTEQTAKEAEDAGRDAGERWGGAFSEQWSKRLTAAIHSIPSIQVTADNTDAERKLAAIRVELEELSGKTVGVDIDAGEAEAKLRELQARLVALSGNDVEIHVRTDAAAAAAELAAVSREAKNADDSVAGIGGSAGVTLSRLGYLVVIGASLGSLVAPAAAAAAVAVAGVGTAAAAAVAGFGVLALGLFGVANAVKKIDAYTLDANKSAKNFADTQDSLISAQQALGDAERNLQYARQDAADAAVAAQQRIADAERNVVKAQRDAAQAVKQAEEQQKQAVQDLARARQDAADSISEATQREGDAERSVTNAVRDQKKAREDLSTALKEAAKDLRDLQLDVKQNQIDIDQATTAAMKAKEDLDKVMSNPRATEIERRQALESYQEKILQIEELKNKQGDLAEQQAKADKEGVEGTDKVKNARQQVADADARAADAARALEKARKDVDKARVDGARSVAAAEKRVADAQTATIKAQQDGAQRVADAQRAVADAQKAAAKQQRDSQRQILSDTEAVASAQRGVAKASRAMGVAGGDAFDTMNDALAKLSPAGQAFAKWLYSLKPQFDELQKTAQQGLLPGLQEGIQTLVSTYLPAFDRFIGRIAIGLGNMFRATGQVLITPEWQAFFGFLDKEALPALQNMWAMAINLATGIANITRALEPLAKPMGKGLVDLTEKFARWSEQLSSNDGFQQFLDYAQRVGPKVVQLIEDLVTFVGRLVIAMAPMGEFLVTVVDGIIGFVNSWNLGFLSGVVDVIAILATGLLVVQGAVKAVNFVQDIWNTISKVSATIQGVLAGAVERYNTATAGAVGSTGLLNGRLFAAKAAGEAGAVGVGAMEAAMGPLGVALLVAGGAWLLFSQNSGKAKQDTGQLGQALQDLGKQYHDAAQDATLGGAAVEDSFRKAVAQSEDLQKAVVALSQLGIGIDQIAGSVGGSVKDLDQSLATINARIKQIDDQIAAANARNAASRGVSHVDTKGLQDEEDHLVSIRDKLVEAADKSSVASQALAILGKVTAQASTASELLSPVQQSLADAQTVLADNTATAQEKMDALTKASDTLRQSQIDGIDAEETFNGSLITLKETVKAAKDEHDKYAKSLGMGTATGLRNRDMIEALIASADRQYDADVAVNGVTEDAIKKGKGHYDQIIKVAGALGINTDKTKALIGQFGKVPKNVETAIGFKEGDFDKMFAQLEMTAFIQEGLKKGESLDSVKARYKSMISDRNRAKNFGFAEGGHLDGPRFVGGKTEDANLIWASKGEYMQQAAAVDYYGTGVMDAINRRAIPRQAFPGYAAGGSVLGGKQKWPFQVDLSKVWIPDDNWLLANTPGLGDGSFHGLSADASVAKIQKFALAQRGKTYLWAAAGPEHYDCSGLVGNLWALATGHSLYHRYMSTSDMGVGRHGMVAGPGQKMTIYLGPGHTAANVGGLHAEAYGGNGVPLAIGRIGTPLSYYTQKLHLPGFARGGPVDPNDLKSKDARLLSFLRYGWPEPPLGSGFNDLLKMAGAGTFDTGGVLPPGMSAVFNGTGRPEAVLTSQQWNAIHALAQNASGGGGNTYNFEFRDTTLDLAKLKALQDREAVLARVGRAR